VQTDAVVPPLSVAKIFRQLIDKEQRSRAGRQAGDRRRQRTDGADAGRLWDRRRPSPARRSRSATASHVTREVDAGLEVNEIDCAVMSVTCA